MKKLYCNYNILIVSGPSGAGKSTLLKFLENNIDNFYFSISTTTRKPRDNEEHGREYFFVSKDDFLGSIYKKEFLEYEEVHGNFYGTSNNQIKEAIKQQKFIVFDVDVRGHNTIKLYYPNAKSIFITPKDLTTLKERLYNRNTDNEDVIQKRLINACEELKYANTFDYLLINDNITESKEAILNIAKSITLINNESKINDLIQHYNFC